MYRINVTNTWSWKTNKENCYHKLLPKGNDVLLKLCLFLLGSNCGLDTLLELLPAGRYLLNPTAAKGFLKCNLQFLPTDTLNEEYKFGQVLALCIFPHCCKVSVNMCELYYYTRIYLVPH